MGRFVVQQAIVAALAAVGFAIIAGKHAGISSALASLCFLIPNTVFTSFFFSAFFRRLPRAMVLFGFLELIKIVLVTGGAGVVFWMYQDLHWIAFLASFVICLASYIFLLSKLKG